MKAEQALTDLANAIRKHGAPICQTTDPDLWFPDQSAGADRTLVQAKKWCEECPVRIQCAIFAIANDEAYGLWGGLNVRTRQAIRNGHMTLKEALEGKKLARKIPAHSRSAKVS